MSISLARITAFSLAGGELCGWLALYLSPEASRTVLALVPLAVLAFFFTGIRLGDRWLFSLLGFLLVSGVGATFLTELPIGLTLSACLLAAHGLLWLAHRPAEYRYWRISLAFLEIILGAILSPEAYMFFLIFFFALIASLSLSFGFLERRFRGDGDMRVPVRFVGAVSLLTFLVFLSSLVIFPILPRSNWSGGGQRWAEPGYSDKVDLHSSLSWAAGTSRPLLWIFLPNGVSWKEVLPFGLVRGDVLDRFDGNTWQPGAKQFIPAGSPRGPAVELFRERLQTDVLPAPYGAERVELGGRVGNHFASGEWPARTQRNRRVSYTVFLGSSERNDPPKAVHRELPNPKLFPEVTRLAKEFGRGREGEARIARVLEYFQGFKWKLADMPGTNEGGIHPVERFLTQTKEGHCELFATAAALLFRAMGMPARVVVGFRASPSGSVLVARNTDAHAWVEVWVKNRWAVVDPSPLAVQPTGWLSSGFSSELINLYDLVSAYWYRYILGYEFDSRMMAARARAWGPTAGAGLALLFFAAGLLRLRRIIRLSRPASPRGPVTGAWLQLEKRLAGRSQEFFARPEGESLRRDYLELRFGPRAPEAMEMRDFAVRVRAAGRKFTDG